MPENARRRWAGIYVKENRMMADEWRTKPSFIARCETCGQEWSSQNAQGIAVQHARKYKHKTTVDKSIIYVYDHEEGRTER